MQHLPHYIILLSSHIACKGPWPLSVKSPPCWALADGASERVCWFVTPLGSTAVRRAWLCHRGWTRPCHALSHQSHLLFPMASWGTIHGAAMGLLQVVSGHVEYDLWEWRRSASCGKQVCRALNVVLTSKTTCLEIRHSVKRADSQILVIHLFWEELIMSINYS